MKQTFTLQYIIKRSTTFSVKRQKSFVIVGYKNQLTKVPEMVKNYYQTNQQKRPKWQKIFQKLLSNQLTKEAEMVKNIQKITINQNIHCYIFKVKGNKKQLFSHQNNVKIITQIQKTYVKIAKLGVVRFPKISSKYHNTPYTRLYHKFHQVIVIINEKKQTLLQISTSKKLYVKSERKKLQNKTIYQSFDKRYRLLYSIVHFYTSNLTCIGGEF
eukprot:TRINITY_DN9878_c0_g1_i2.p2 TRINITY_DN9878_c0_g1~~TRINITY_DN9878_c0_g1_i2.p2  ORF type:complete len:214 (+),score=-1.07 TRINITY_DN9878_c0_g1_i2:221-862(+)